MAVDLREGGMNVFDLVIKNEQVGARSLFDPQRDLVQEDWKGIYRAFNRDRYDKLYSHFVMATGLVILESNSNIARKPDWEFIGAYLGNVYIMGVNFTEKIKTVAHAKFLDPVKDVSSYFGLESEEEIWEAAVNIMGITKESNLLRANLAVEMAMLFPQHFWEICPSPSLFTYLTSELIKSQNNRSVDEVFEIASRLRLIFPDQSKKWFFNYDLYGTWLDRAKLTLDICRQHLFYRKFANLASQMTIVCASEIEIGEDGFKIKIGPQKEIEGNITELPEVRSF